jgi:hypothetical protein
MKAICTEPIVVPDENNKLIKYEAGQVFEMDKDIFEALKEAGVRLQKVDK